MSFIYRLLGNQAGQATKAFSFFNADSNLSSVTLLFATTLVMAAEFSARKLTMSTDSDSSLLLKFAMGLKQAIRRN